MEYLLSCQCGKQTPVTRSQAGQEVLCQCGQTLQVPTLRGLSQLPTAQVDSKSVASERSVWSGWRGTTMAISLAIFALFAAPCGYYVLERLRIDTSYTVEDELKNGDEIIDSYSDTDLVKIWFGNERKGLGLKSKPSFYWARMWATDREMMATITGGVAATAGIFALGVWFTAKK